MGILDIKKRVPGVPACRSDILALETLLIRMFGAGRCLASAQPLGVVRTQSWLKPQIEEAKNPACVM